MDGISGRVAVVTGGGSGIGAAVAGRLDAEGASVVVVDRDGDAARQVARPLSRAAAFTADVSDEEGVCAYMRFAVQEFGAVHMVHLNAGIAGSFEPLVDLSVEEFDKVIAVNLRSVFLGLREAMRSWVAAGIQGSIAVTASTDSLKGGEVLTPYTASKHGVIGLVRSAALQGAPHGIRVNAIAPGCILTPLDALLREHFAGRNVGAQNPSGRLGTVEEIASLVVYALSDECRFMTGSVLVADGGVTAG